jgi:hypothetical protein
LRQSHAQHAHGFAAKREIEKVLTFAAESLRKLRNGSAAKRGQGG